MLVTISTKSRNILPKDTLSIYLENIIFKRIRHRCLLKPSLLEVAAFLFGWWQFLGMGFENSRKHLLVFRFAESHILVVGISNWYWSLLQWNPSSDHPSFESKQTDLNKIRWKRQKGMPAGVGDWGNEWDELGEGRLVEKNFVTHWGWGQRGEGKPQ